MAQFTVEQMLKKEVQTVKEFAKSLSITPTACYYACKQSLVDYFVLGDRTYIVMTAFTKQYKPNSSPRRKKVAKKRKK